MHSKPIAVGLNCALGAKQMKPFLQRLHKVRRRLSPLRPSSAPALSRRHLS